MPRHPTQVRGDLYRQTLGFWTRCKLCNFQPCSDNLLLSNIDVGVSIVVAGSQATSGQRISSSRVLVGERTMKASTGRLQSGQGSHVQGSLTSTDNP